MTYRNRALGAAVGLGALHYATKNVRKNASKANYFTNYMTSGNGLVSSCDANATVKITIKHKGVIYSTSKDMCGDTCDTLSDVIAHMDSVNVLVSTGEMVAPLSANVNDKDGFWVTRSVVTKMLDICRSSQSKMLIINVTAYTSRVKVQGFSYKIAVVTEINIGKEHVSRSRSKQDTQAMFSRSRQDTQPMVSRSKQDDSPKRSRSRQDTQPMVSRSKQDGSPKRSRSRQRSRSGQVSRNSLPTWAQGTAKSLARQAGEKVGDYMASDRNAITRWGARKAAGSYAASYF